MKNIKLELQYDGTSYHGWQRQINALSVQQIIEDTLSKITGECISVVGCGRTDAGVHANSYIANFKSGTKIPSEKLHYALNSRLPRDIRCIRAENVDDDFHSKYCAKKKKYSYYILNSNIPNVFKSKYTWQYKHPLNVENMQKAAKAFVGTHDFVGFASAGLTVKTTVRTIYSLNVYEEGDIITIDVVGNGFLYNMVRIIAGTLVFIGGGKINVNDIKNIIDSCDRNRAGITAPPQGLFLTEVYY